MFHQLLTPVAGNLWASFAMAALPIATVLVLLGVLRYPAWLASLGGLLVGIVLALALWRFPPPLAINAIAAGVAFAVWPVMWIVVNALLLYNLAVLSGRFNAFRDWVLQHLPDDRRVVLVVVGFCFGALLEGISGFGTPVAITSALLVLLGFAPREALTYTLIFNTAPVAFGALGVPITTLGAVTHLSDVTLGAMIGRQLPFIAFLLPFYVCALYGGWRSIRALWPLLLVAAASFAITQFVVSNYVSYVLTDVLSSLGSLALTLGFLRLWRPAPDPTFSIPARQLAQATSAGTSGGTLSGATLSAWQAWLPWLLVSAVVIVWTSLHLPRLLELKFPWPHLHNAVFITLYGTPYGAIWDIQPFATGTAILCAAILAAALMGCRPRVFLQAVGLTWRQSRVTILTVGLIVGLAYLMNYSGLNYTLGLGIASAGLLFPLLSAFLGWVAVFLSGSDTSGNALFGNLQVAAAHQLHLSPVLFAATNSAGGVMGKMVSPQNLATGASVTALQGQEGAVLAITFKHSIVLTLLLGALVAIQQYVTPWMVPS
ncbi:MAG TPA: L-lactate permease [Steroidobacteraceae bacterium]|nr:L-lactate permease [Steroidobacteraceae bacterium]